jgi:hypothetical protein
MTHWKRAVPRKVRKEYDAAVGSGDVGRQLAAMEAVVTAAPDATEIWYDLGMWHKWLRNWEASRSASSAALALLDDTVESPEAWNLGIAATALGDWATARRAWRAYGVDVPGEGDEPIRGAFGVAPVRLNPDPRFHEPELLVDGQRWSVETVWGRRLCPARIEIESVPTPESGHRFGDVVLHDGDTVGERRYGDRVLGVFNEIALLERSPYVTLRTELGPVGEADVDALSEAFFRHGYAAECWTTSMQVLCRACSEGSVESREAEHDHAPDEPPGQQTTGFVMGIGAPRDEAERLLREWGAASAGREYDALVEA